MEVSRVLSRSAAVGLLVMQAGCESGDTPPHEPAYVSLTGPVNYLGNTSYLVNVELGTPPQTVPMVLDTGSSTLIVNAKDCPDCEKWNPGRPSFDASKSSSWKPAACDDQNCPKPDCDTPEECEAQGTCMQCYGETSDCQFCIGYLNNFGDIIGNSGIWGSDIARVGPVETRVDLGLTKAYVNAESGYSEHSGGVFGMQLEVLNNVVADRNKFYPAFMNRAVDGTGTEGMPYSLCVTNDGGTLLFGEKDTAHMMPGTEVVVPYGKSDYDIGQALIDFEGFKINGADLNVESTYYAENPVDFDCGTGPWTVGSVFYDALKAQFCVGSTDAEACEQVRLALFNEDCTALTDEQMASLPTLTSTFGGKTFTVVPREYLLEGQLAEIVTTNKPCKSGEYIVGFASMPMGSEVSLYGAVYMRNFSMYFDTPNRNVVIARQRGCVVSE